MPPQAGKSLEGWVRDLLNAELREQALAELSKQREKFPQLAPYLWRSFGTMAVLLQELTVVYPQLGGELDMSISNRVCNALALLQCVASHDETRQLFLDAKIPLYLYPFLNTSSKERPFEYLRLTALGVIGALVKQDDSSSIIGFLLSTEIIPLCLRTMELGSELSKTVATFITQKILQDELGLSYVCATPERFYAVGAVLQQMLEELKKNPSARQLKHIVRCYLRLADNMRARQALQEHLQSSLLNPSINWQEGPEPDGQLAQLLDELRVLLSPHNIDHSMAGMDLRMPGPGAAGAGRGGGGGGSGNVVQVRAGQGGHVTQLGVNNMGGGGGHPGTAFAQYGQYANNVPPGSFRRV